MSPRAAEWDPMDISSPAGRFAPSPTGDLHVGNLRTALLAWLFARSTGRRFVIRIEDLDRVRAGSAARQLADLAALGLDHDGPVEYQSLRGAVYDEALARLAAAGRTYECFCTRREVAAQIAAAASAPQRGDGVPPGAYPGTCLHRSAADRARLRESGRPPALRLRTAEVESFTVRDEFAGEFTGAVDDFVLRRTDGVIAYNLAVVVDDGQTGIDQVVRADDLLDSAPRQAYLATLLGLPVPTYAHVPLALGPTGDRLAKRDGAVTLADLAAHGIGPAQVLGVLAVSLGLAARSEHVTPSVLQDRFDPAALPRTPWRVDPHDLVG